MKTKMQLTPKVAPKIKLSTKILYAAGGIVLATLIGTFLFIQLNLGNPFRSLAAPTIFQSQSTGTWETNSVWQGGVWPGADLNANDVIIKSSHTVTRNGNITGNNNVVITIEVNAKLVINGDLTVDNDLILNNKGTLIITGGLNLKNNAQVTVLGGGSMVVGNNITSANNTNLTVDGSLTVGGNVVAGSNLTFTGSGTVSIAGSGCNKWTGSKPCSGVIILPVELMSFEAKDDGDGSVKISWATAQEKNNDHFTIQRSIDGIIYLDIETVPGNGTKGTVSRYETKDMDPSAERLYYRLTQTDYDGLTEIFDPKFVQVELQATQITAYPNPMTGRSLTVRLPKAETGSIQFVNSTGEVVLNKETDGISNTVELEFDNDLLQGFYYLKYKSLSGSTQILKIVKR